MSQADFPDEFAFQDVNVARAFLRNEPFPSSAEQDNLPGLQRFPGYAGPIGQQSGRGYAAQQQEIKQGKPPTLANTIPAAQQQMRAQVQQDRAAGKPAYQPETFRARLPVRAPGYFGRSQQQPPAAPIPAAHAVTSGPNNYSLGSCTPDEGAEIKRRAAHEKSKKALGPRDQAKCRTQAKVVKPRSAARPGPEKRADDNPWALKKAWARHIRDCSDAEWCTEDCILRKFWPRVWEEEKQQTKVRDAASGEMVFCLGLWSHKYKNRSGYEGPRPALKK